VPAPKPADTSFAAVKTGLGALTPERCDCGMVEGYWYRDPETEKEHETGKFIAAGNREEIIEAVHRVHNARLDGDGRLGVGLRLDMLDWRLGRNYRPDLIAYLLPSQPRVTIREA